MTDETGLTKSFRMSNITLNQPYLLVLSTGRYVFPCVVVVQYHSISCRAGLKWTLLHTFSSTWARTQYYKISSLLLLPQCRMSFYEFIFLCFFFSSPPPSFSHFFRAKCPDEKCIIRTCSPRRYPARIWCSDTSLISIDHCCCCSTLRSAYTIEWSWPAVEIEAIAQRRQAAVMSTRALNPRKGIKT